MTAGIPLLLASEHPCSYLYEQQARSVFVHPHYPMTADVYAELMTQGFRRGGGAVYRPRCPVCKSCLPSRIAVADFKQDRSQKRCVRRNAATTVTIKPPIFDPEHYALYLRYQAHQHPGSDMINTNPEDFLAFLACPWCDTGFVEFRIAGQLAAVAVVDFFPLAWSAVYTFYAPEFSTYSLGVYAVLWQIQELQQCEGLFVYLGFWIAECKKMAYKQRFQPLQILVDNQWVVLDNQHHCQLDAAQVVC